MSAKTDLTSTAGLNKAIDGIKAAGAKLDAHIQTVGVAVAVHFAANNDVRVVNRLYTAMPKGARHAAMASWLMAHFAVTPNTSKVKTEREEMPFLNDKAKKTNAEAAAAEMWYDHKPSKEPMDVFDLQKAIKQVLAKAKGAKSLTHGDANTLKALAKAVGIPESDVPTLAKDIVQKTEKAPV